MTFVSEDPKHKDPKPFTRRSKTMVVIAVLSLLIISTGLHAGWALAFENKIYPGVRVGDMALGGLTREEAARILQTRFAELISQGATLSVDDRSIHIDLDVIAESDPDLSRPLLDADIATAIEDAYAKGRSRNAVLNLFLGLLPVFERPHIAVPMTMDRTGISDRILSAFPEYDVEPAPTRFLITKEHERWRVAVMEGEIRTTLDTTTPLSALEIEFSRLDRESLSTPLSISPVTLKPEVSLEKAVSLIPDAEAVLAAAPFSISHEDSGETHAWSLRDEDLSLMLVPTRNGLDLNREALVAFFEPVTADVNVEARDARFSVNGSRVETFIPSRMGREVDVEASAALLREAVLSRTQEPVALVVHETEPNVVLAEANDLGIKERLGTGTSSYAGSPSNRIKNIRNGVRLLNGLLIPPGETFSLLGALAPFTTQNGYLPELVIKGDKIIPEIGGGLCQIGSTTFRATMNAGLEVAERRNHSLVVSYYNDPSNGNPGTDATIYSPAPDYKFVNNTPGYLLFEAVMDETSKQLLFSFWGTNDGRRGWYDPPVVEQWFGAGETRMIETTDIPAGTTQCQSAHPGANASFTYHVRTADGTLTDRVFTSSYRSLPKVCLVGVEPSLEDVPSELSSEPEETTEPISTSDL